MFAVGASLSVPFFTIVTRKSYGLGAMAMAGGMAVGGNVFHVSWPSAEAGPMGVEGAVELGFSKELAEVSGGSSGISSGRCAAAKRVISYHHLLVLLVLVLLVLVLVLSTTTTYYYYFLLLLLLLPGGADLGGGAAATLHLARRGGVRARRCTERCAHAGDGRRDRSRRVARVDRDGARGKPAAATRGQGATGQEAAVRLSVVIHEHKKVMKTSR